MRAYCLLFVRAPGEQEINNLPWIRTRVRAYTRIVVLRGRLLAVLSCRYKTERGGGKGERKRERKRKKGKQNGDRNGLIRHGSIVSKLRGFEVHVRSIESVKYLS